MTETAIPEGFVASTRPSPVTDPWEPIYEKPTPDAIILGLFLRTAHTNRRGLIHGGVIAALADKAMGHSCGHTMIAAGAKPSLVTVNLSLDYVGTAKIGQWLTIETDVIRTGKTICFTQCLVKADGDIIARGNATFRVVAPKA